MNIRRYNSIDCCEMVKLFHNTVHTINANDYSQAQLEVWATGVVDVEMWNKSFNEHITYVAEIDKEIVGFGDMNNQGYLDRLYVHKDYQRKGIATAIVNALEAELRLMSVTSFCTYSSITGRPFFEKQGYKVVRENIVVKNGVELINFEMLK